MVVVAGHVSNGAARWIKLGLFSMQPTDVARLAVVVFVASWLKRHPPGELGFWKGVGPALLVVGGFAGLILLQPNLSSAALLGLGGLTVIYLAGARPLHLLLPIGGGAPPPWWRCHPSVSDEASGVVLLPVPQHEIRGAAGSWISHDHDRLGRVVLGERPPEAHTDFIFRFSAKSWASSAARCCGVAGLYIWRCLRAAARASDPFAGLLAAGLTVQIGLYAIVNLAVATGLAPTTGLPLPFVSYGGSALLANLAAAGLLYRVSAGNDEREALAKQRWARPSAPERGAR